MEEPVHRKQAIHTHKNRVWLQKQAGRSMGILVKRPTVSSPLLEMGEISPYISQGSHYSRK